MLRIATSICSIQQPDHHSRSGPHFVRSPQLVPHVKFLKLWLSCDKHVTPGSYDKNFTKEFQKQWVPLLQKYVTYMSPGASEG